jgi:hypothetical protein
MKKLLFAAAAIIASTACVGFEHERNIITPSAPTLPSAPSGGSGALTGTWSSVVPLTVPNSWSCGSFQWSVSSQTSNSMAGEFYAICAGVVLVQGNASGQLNGAATEVALQLNGTATVQGVITCPFSLTGTGYILDQNTIRIPYSGTTCMGPVHGEETLRRPASPDEPPPPPPAPPPVEPPGEPAPIDNPHHVGPGPLTPARAEQVIHATGREFPHLTAPPPSESEGVARAEELLLRTIWHLKLAGFDAARQRNPSGAISNDKLNIFLDGRWRAFDIFLDLGRPGVPITTIFYEVFPASPLAYPGISD